MGVHRDRGRSPAGQSCLPPLSSLKVSQRVGGAVMKRWMLMGASAFAMWKDSCFMEVKMSEMLAIDDKLKELQVRTEGRRRSGEGET
eukprot:758888-Hanusia_phi.AAC.4